MEATTKLFNLWLLSGMLTHFLCFILVNFIIIVIIFTIILPFNLLNSFKVKLSIFLKLKSILFFQKCIKNKIQLTKFFLNK